MATIENLVKAFIGESQARNRYTIYAKIAKKQGFEQISEVFLLTADQEAEHAKWLFRMIQDLKGDAGAVSVEVEAPLVLGDTAANLKASIAGENHEYTIMYPSFADEAEKEGLGEVAKRLRAIAVAEKNHEARYKLFLEEVESNSVFKKPETQSWVCRKCGYVHEGEAAPQACPSCGHPTAYFQLKCRVC